MSTRRDFFKQSALTSSIMMTRGSIIDAKIDATRSPLKTSLNAFSFNEPLTSGKMTIDDMITYCATSGFLGVDITGYYFKGYPNVPDDDYLFHTKRFAFKKGIEISGTGVRNDFTEPDPTKRKESVKLVKAWIEAASKLGAPVIRVFAGNQQSPNFKREQVLEWMTKDLSECIEHGAKHGVVVGLQNHDDFIKTADQALEIIKPLQSDWFGLILDTGSYRQNDPYAEIEKTAAYSVNWQIKEKVFMNGKEQDVNMDKLIKVIQRSGYTGYIPLETLGDGDPKPKISSLFNSINNSISKL
ncbi:MAG: sugar phosphate isomerase/epimerase family protein [Chryseolinea sp.]